jgi:hypothetical protein
LTRPNIAVNTYMYATPSGAVDDGAFFIGYTVAYDSGYQVGCFMDTYGAARVNDSSIFGTRNSAAVEIGASSLAAKKFSFNGDIIENYNIAGTGNALAVYCNAGSFPEAPFYNCTLRGHPTTNNVPSFAGVISSWEVVPGEIKCVSGALTGGAVNTIAFAWQNSDSQNVFVTRVVLEIATPGATPTAVIQVGLASSLTGTGLGSEFFTGINATVAAVRDSYLATDTGAQTKYIVVIRIPAGGNTCVVGKIITEAAAALAGKYYIYYTGRNMGY